MNHSSEGTPGNPAAECGSRSGLPWYCINTHPGQAEQALRHIRYQGFTAWYPQRRLPPLPSKKPKPDRYLPLFPNYMFVTFQVGVDHWHPLMNTHGVKHLFRVGSAPALLAATDIQLIESQEDIPPDPNAPRPPLVRAKLLKFEEYAGQEVTIQDGAFQGTKAMCEWSDAERVRLLVTILGKAVRMTLRRKQVTSNQ